MKLEIEPINKTQANWNLEMKKGLRTRRKNFKCRIYQETIGI